MGSLSFFHWANKGGRAGIQLFAKGFRKCDGPNLRGVNSIIVRMSTRTSWLMRLLCPHLPRREKFLQLIKESLWNSIYDSPRFQDSKRNKLQGAALLRTFHCERLYYLGGCHEHNCSWISSSVSRTLLWLTTIFRENVKQNISWRDFPAGPVVKTLPCNAGDAGSIPGQGTKIPPCLRATDWATATEPAGGN